MHSAGMHGRGKTTAVTASALLTIAIEVEGQIFGYLIPKDYPARLQVISKPLNESTRKEIIVILLRPSKSRTQR